MNHDRVSDVFNKAIDLPESEREAYLDEACEADDALRAEVASLLQFARDSPTNQDSCSIGLLPGSKLKNYRIVQRIGEGGFGVVYLAAQDVPVRRRVAIKIIKPGMDTRAVVSRFQAEREALAIMDHPGIARILDGGATDDDRPYFVMEYVKGVPINDFADTEQLDFRQRIDLFLSACEAVQHAHGRGFIHRDLKPSNILVGFVDGSPQVKVIDFGIAKALDRDPGEIAHMTQDGRMLGTPEYMSPEQASTTNLGVDVRSDVYALGVVLYQILTSRLPFQEDMFQSSGLGEIRRKICEEEPVPPSTRISRIRRSSQDELDQLANQRGMDSRMFEKTLRGDLDWIVLKCLQKSRTRRYETVVSLQTDLRRFLANEPIEARPPSRFYRIGKFAARNKALVGISATAILALIVGFIITLELLDRTIEQNKALTQQRIELLAKEKALNHVIEQKAKAMELLMGVIAGLKQEEVIRVFDEWSPALSSEHPAGGRRAAASNVVRELIFDSSHLNLEGRLASVAEFDLALAANWSKQLARQALELGIPESALRYADLSIRYSSLVDDPLLHASAWSMKADALSAGGQKSQAETIYRQLLLECTKNPDDAQLQSRCWYARNNLAELLNDPEEKLALHVENEAWARQSGITEKADWSRDNRANALLRVGRFQESYELYEVIRQSEVWSPEVTRHMEKASGHAEAAQRSGNHAESLASLMLLEQAITEHGIVHGHLFEDTPERIERVRAALENATVSSDQ